MHEKSHMQLVCYCGCCHQSWMPFKHQDYFSYVTVWLVDNSSIKTRHLICIHLNCLSQNMHSNVVSFHYFHTSLMFRFVTFLCIICMLCDLKLLLWVIKCIILMKKQFFIRMINWLGIEKIQFPMEKIWIFHKTLKIPISTMVLICML